MPLEIFHVLQELQSEKEDLKTRLSDCEEHLLDLTASLNEEHTQVSERITCLDANKTKADGEIEDADLKYDQAVVDVLSLAEGDINELKGYSAPPSV